MSELVRGVITVRIGEGRKLYNTSFLSGKASTFIRLGTHPGFHKRSRVVPASYGSPKWDEMKHIPVFISPNLTNGAPTKTKIGSLKFHVHDIVRKAPVSGWFALHQESHANGELFLEFSFSYGAFGYNYCNQLMDEGVSPESRALHSLYPSMAPPKERTETDRATLVPRALPHPPFIPFREQITLGFGQKIEEFPVLSHRLKLSDIKERISQEKTRIGRLSMLSDIILAPHRSEEVYIESDVEEGNNGGYSSFVIPTDLVQDFSSLRRGGPSTQGAAQESLQSRGLLTRLERRLSWFQREEQQKDE